MDKTEKRRLRKRFFLKRLREPRKIISEMSYFIQKMINIGLKSLDLYKKKTFKK